MGFLETTKQGYQIMGQEAKQKIIDNRANIFTGVSVIGTIATGIISAFAGAKSARQIDAKAAEIGRPLDTKEKAKLCWKNFILPAGTIIGSGAGAIGSNRIMAGDIARLTTDVALVTKGYNEFRRATQEVISEKQQEQLRAAIAEKEIQKIDEKELKHLPQPSLGAGNRPQLFKERFTGIKWWSTRDKVMLGMKNAQDMMRELKPRIRMGYSNQVLGVSLLEILTQMGAPIDYYLDRDITVFKDYGFNRGYEADGSDDDDIEVYLTPGETNFEGEDRSCYILDWAKDPSDMRLGDMLKSADL